MQEFVVLIMITDCRLWTYLYDNEQVPTCIRFACFERHKLKYNEYIKYHHKEKKFCSAM